MKATAYYKHIMIKDGSSSIKLELYDLKDYILVK